MGCQVERLFDLVKKLLFGTGEDGSGACVPLDTLLGRNENVVCRCVLPLLILESFFELEILSIGVQHFYFSVRVRLPLSSCGCHGWSFL
jgi:hypothetical protein